MNRFRLLCALASFMALPCFAGNPICANYSSRNHLAQVELDSKSSQFRNAIQSTDADPLRQALALQPVWSPEDHQAMLAFTLKFQTENKMQLDAVAPDLDHSAVQVLFAEVKDALTKRIAQSSSLSSEAKIQMQNEIFKTEMLLPGDSIAFLSEPNQFELAYETANHCGPDSHGLPANSFSINLEQKSYVVVCPGEFAWTALSPLGIRSMVFNLAHEIVHSLRLKENSADFPDAQILTTYSREHAALIECWKRSLISELKTPSHLYSQLKGEDQKEFFDLLRTTQTRLGRPADAIDLHAFEMIPDYWALQTLKQFLTEDAVLSQNKASSIAENLITYCDSSGDDGEHLPDAIRLQWLSSDPEIELILESSKASFEWCQIQ